MLKVCFSTATCLKYLKAGGGGGVKRHYQITSARLNSESTSSRSDQERLGLINGTPRSQIDAVIIANALRLHQSAGREEKVQLSPQVSISVQSISTISSQIGLTH